MAIVLFRVDERLIHGQVIIGWGHHLRPDRYVLVDDELAGSSWEQELYRLGAAEAEVVFATTDDARGELGEWAADSSRTVVLTRDIPTMRWLGSEGGLAGQEVNLGGIHHGPGRREVLPYLNLTEEDVEDLRALADAGAIVSARDLPDASRVSLSTLLER